MNPPYRPNKYELRAPPPIPPRPGSVSNSGSYERAPPLPPRPSYVSEDRLPQQHQPQTPPSPHNYQPAYPQQQNVSANPYAPTQTEQCYASANQQSQPENSRPYSISEDRPLQDQTQTQPPPYNHQPAYHHEQNDAQYHNPQRQTEHYHVSTNQQSEPEPTHQYFASEHRPTQTQPPFYKNQPVYRLCTKQFPSHQEKESTIHERNHVHARAATPAPPPKIQYAPPARFTLRKCPTTIYKLTSGGAWYIHPQVPEFTSCVYCYEKHIRSTQFQSSFNPWTSPAGSKPQCLFSSPRIENSLWPRALQSGSLTDVVQFFAHRLNLSVRNCPGEGKAVAATEGVKWFQLNDNYRSKFPLFAACEACYEDVLLASPLKGEFAPCTKPQAEDTMWACDVAVAFIQKLVLKGDLGAFISHAERHLNLLECEKGGKMVDGRTRRWYQPRPTSSSPGEEITICEHCCHDFVTHSEFKDHFQLFNPPAESQQLCILGLYQARTVWAEALDQHDFSLFHRTMLAFIQCPPCTPLIQPGTAIYQISGVDNFDVCQSRQWYGNDTCRICPSCYEENVSEFMQFASYRASTYVQTVPEMRNLVQQAKLNLNMQKMHNTTSTFYNNMNGASAWQYNPNIRYTGGSVGGSFATPWGVTGAQEGAAAWGYMQGIQGMAAMVKQLEGMWHAVG
ncbi:hypothetical protein BDV12DRAFT_187028 [Aspergillus spectabilis]